MAIKIRFLNYADRYGEPPNRLQGTNRQYKNDESKMTKVFSCQYTTTVNAVSIFTVAILLLSCTPQISKPIVRISAPTIEQEASSIWRTINDIDFLTSQGYRINLPENELMDSLVEASRSGRFGNQDYSLIYNFLATGGYRQTDYDSALSAVKAQRSLIENVIEETISLSKTWDWAFKIFEKYEITFTLYGTGGSYDPDSGLITLFTTTDGKFMNYENPANTIIHEFVHLGMEESIVQKYNLSHQIKESLVDRFVYLLYGKYLPDYKIQNMGNIEMDRIIASKNDLAELEKFFPLQE